MARTKAMQILTDLNTKLLKTVIVNVLESMYDRKVSYGMLNVVEDSGEGCFFNSRQVRLELLKKLPWCH
jgi:hypothetical protein